MKIVSAEILSYSLRLGEDIHKVQGDWKPLLLRLTTDEGIVGLGEAGLAYGVGRRAGVGMLHDMIEAFVIGRDPFDREAIWNDMQRRSFWGGAAGPVVNAAMSAVDIALWDIAGKALGMPVWKLLGGRVQADLRAYASQIQFGWEEDFFLYGQPGQYADAARKAVAQGYDAVKVDPVMNTEDGELENPDRLKGALDKAVINRARARMEAIRDAVGPDVDIILELHSFTSLTGSQQLAEACADLDLFMVEEAVNYNSDRPARTLKQRCPQVRLAAGERIFTRWQYRGYLEDGSLDMLQPDFCLAGGISEGRKIADMAHAYEVTIQGHVCGGPVSSLAAMHIETAIPNFQIHEHHINSTCADNRHICHEDYQPVQGRLVAPDAPGLGLTLNDAFAARHASVVTVKV